MTFFYTATFGATWLTTPWLYPTEVRHPTTLWFYLTRIDIPPNRTRQRRRLVRSGLVDRQRRGNDDNALPVPGHRIRHAAGALWTEFLCDSVPAGAVPGDGGAESGADGRFL